MLQRTSFAADAVRTSSLTSMIRNARCLRTNGVAVASSALYPAASSRRAPPGRQSRLNVSGAMVSSPLTAVWKWPAVVGKSPTVPPPSLSSVTADGRVVPVPDAATSVDELLTMRRALRSEPAASDTLGYVSRPITSPLASTSSIVSVNSVVSTLSSAIVTCTLLPHTPGDAAVMVRSPYAFVAATGAVAPCARTTNATPPPLAKYCAIP